MYISTVDHLLLLCVMLSGTVYYRMKLPHHYTSRWIHFTKLTMPLSTNHNWWYWLTGRRGMAAFLTSHSLVTIMVTIGDWQLLDGRKYFNGKIGGRCYWFPNGFGVGSDACKTKIEGWFDAKLNIATCLLLDIFLFANKNFQAYLETRRSRYQALH